MKIEQFVYKNNVDAFTYVIVFVLSVVLPIGISLKTENALLLAVTMLINAMSLLRDYAMLLEYKKVRPRFWLERLVGIASSVVIIVYGIVVLFLIASGTSYECFSTSNKIFSVLFLFPGVIAAIEGIIYTKDNYNANVIKPIKIATNTTVYV